MAASGCVGSGDPNARTWTPKRPHEALQTGVSVRTSYCPMICPCVEDVHVVNRDGSFVTTFDELRAVLRPIDTVERALAYRDLLGDVELDRNEALRALQHTTPLQYEDGEKPSYGVYVAVDAKRWGVGTAPVLDVGGEAIVVTQPSFRQAEYPPRDAEAWSDEDSRVELVRETIHRDGRYEREVLRVLETGKAALVHQPPPLL